MLTKHKFTINLSNNIWEEVERYKQFAHKQSTEETIIELIRSALMSLEDGKNVAWKNELHLNEQFLGREHSGFILQMSPVIQMTDDQLYHFCQINRELRIERTKEGEIIIMPPTGGETGYQNLELLTALHRWSKLTKNGVAFDSSTGFILPNGAIRSPDAAWVRRERLASLTPNQKKQFLRLCPDFVVELRSPSDKLSVLQEKMEEYLENGAQLGWLIDPQEQRVYIYRPHQNVECLEDPADVSGDPLLPGFVLNLQEIWTPDF
jgi:Uma2 family endonuclease